MPKYTPEYCDRLLAANPQACAGLYDRIMKLKVIADVADHTTFVLSALEDGPKSGIQVAVWCRANGDPGLDGELAKRICDRLVREGKLMRERADDGVLVYSVAAAEAERESQPVEIIAESAAMPAAAEPPTPKREWSSPKTKVLPKLPETREAIDWPSIMMRFLGAKIGVPVYVDVPAGKSPSVFARDIRGRLHAGVAKQCTWAVSHQADCVQVSKIGLNPKYPGTEDFQQQSAVLSVRGTSPISDTLFVAVSHIDVKIAALQAEKVRLIEMAQRFQEQI